jgi:hypothetical protein
VAEDLPTTLTGWTAECIHKTRIRMCIMLSIPIGLTFTQFYRYHVVISIAEDGSLQLDRPIENLKGDLKVRVIAGSFEQTSKVLSDFKALSVNLLPL